MQATQQETRHYYFAFSTWAKGRSGGFGCGGGRTLDQARAQSRLSAERHGYNRCVEIENADGEIVESWTFWPHGPGAPTWLEGRVSTRALAERMLQTRALQVASVTEARQDPRYRKALAQFMLLNGDGWDLRVWAADEHGVAPGYIGPMLCVSGRDNFGDGVTGHIRLDGSFHGEPMDD